jgi:hypothetical protein
LMFSLVAYQNASSNVIPAVISHILGAVWKWEKTEHSFGKIEQNKAASFEFQFTNTGNDPVIITNVQASCGCTTPSYSKEPVMPGQIGKVTAAYNAAAMGNFTKTVTVTANTDKPIVLTISGEVVASTGVKQ